MPKAVLQGLFRYERRAGANFPKPVASLDVDPSIAEDLADALGSLLEGKIPGITLLHTHDKRLRLRMTPRGSGQLDFSLDQSSIPSPPMFGLEFRDVELIIEMLREAKRHGDHWRHVDARNTASEVDIEDVVVACR